MNSDSPDTFVRIEFTAREIDALQEVRNFWAGLDADTIARPGGNLDVKMKLRSMRQVCKQIGKNPHNGDFLPVDLTKELCDNAYDACEFVATLLTDELRTGARNLRGELFATVIIGLKAKMTAGSQLFAQRSRPAIFLPGA